MNPHVYRSLEFDTLLHLLAGLTATSLGREACLNIMPSGYKNTLVPLIRQVRELIELQRIEGQLPLSDIHDVRPALNALHVEGTILDPKVLLKVGQTLHSISSLHQWHKKCGTYYPNLKRLFLDLKPLPELQEKINGAISEWGLIKDEASQRLQAIRQKLHTLRGQINRQLNALFERSDARNVFRERLISVRNNRFVVPVRSDQRGILHGIIHDSSQSKATIYLEPLSIVPLNNDWTEQQRAEKEEEHKILLKLAEEVRIKSDDILFNLKILTQIDCLAARAKIGEILQARFPEISKTELKLKEVYHPLLLLQYFAAEKPEILPSVLKKQLLSKSSKNAVRTPRPVPISLSLSPRSSTLIISGPNAGGKTVTLKTTGLLCLMFQSGIPVPAGEGSSFPVFRNIFVDIGDEQNLQAHLSTFSARIKNFNTILNAVDAQSLVLLDELGTGTDPAEGSALALAILDYLRETGAYTLITTHFQALKAYGAITEGIQNAAVSFDGVSGRPTFQLIYGYAGESNALEIALQHGLSPAILEKARQYLGRKEENGQVVLRELERLRTETSELKEEYEGKKKEVSRLRTILENEKEELEKKKQHILQDAFQEAREKIREAETQFHDLIGFFRKEGLRKSPEVRQRINRIKENILQDLSPLKHHIEVRPEYKGKVEVGEQVMVTSCRKPGKLLRVFSDKGNAEVQVGGIRLKVSMDNIIPFSGTDRAIETVPFLRREPLSVHPMIKSELNVIGKNVEEAIQEVDKAIDSAILAGLEQITLIHGHGTGRLRTGLHEYLDSNPQVKNFYFPPLQQGGQGVTIVELKD